jgi:hypothetical protein
LRDSTRSIKEIVQFNEEELTEEKIGNKTRQTLKILDKIAVLYAVALKQAARVERTPKSKKRSYLPLYSAIIWSSSHRLLRALLATGRVNGPLSHVAPSLLCCLAQF